MDGSGKVFIHDSREGPGEWSSTRAKRCLRVRETHDLETTQHVLSGVGSSCRWSTMRSRISGGREDDMMVSVEPLASAVSDAGDRTHWLVRLRRDSVSSPSKCITCHRCNCNTDNILVPIAGNFSGRVHNRPACYLSWRQLLSQNSKTFPRLLPRTSEHYTD